MPVDFTLPPDTRAIGTGNPPQDIDNIIDALTAMGVGMNVLNSAYSGGADPSGAADSYPAIQAALNAAPAGQKVAVPPGTYLLSQMPAVPSDVGLVAVGAQVLNPPPGGAILKPSASFSGSAVVSMASGSMLSGFGIDGSALPAGTVAGISGGSAVGCVVDHMLINSVTGNGFDVGSGARGWHVSHCKINAAGGVGVALANHTDGLWFDVHVLGPTSHGWSISGSPANSRFIACRAEWSSTGDGFHLVSAWGTGTGSGGCLFSGCSTDRNNSNGFGITSTGTTPILLSGCMLRRDGRNAASGGGGFSGLQVHNATMPVTVAGLTVFPGVDDNGGGTSSPQNGVSVDGSTSVTIDNSYIQAATTPVNNGGGNTFFSVGPSVVQATGTTAAPTVTAANALTLAGATNARGALLQVTQAQAAPTNPGINFTGQAAADAAAAVLVAGDAASRWRLSFDGKSQWGNGTLATDTNLYRTGVGQLKTDTQFIAGGTITGSNLHNNASPFGNTPTAPATTVSTTLVMMGLGSTWTFTPNGSGTLLVCVTGYANTATAVANITLGARFGTGTAPVNGAAVTGTRWGALADPTIRAPGAATGVDCPFSFTALLTGQAISTALWFDIALATGTAADAAQVHDLGITIVELG